MQELAVETLHDHEMNEVYFDPMDGEKWNKFLESVRTSGILEPLVITQDNVIVSGHQRKRACIELGIPYVKCEVREYCDHDGLSKEEWILKDLIETNVRQRGDVGGSELKIVRRVDALCDLYRITRSAGRPKKLIVDNVDNYSEKPTTVPEVCALAGTSVDRYRANAPLKDLESEFIEMLDSGAVPTSVAARIIAKLTPEQQQELLSLLPDGIYVSGAVANEYIRQIQNLTADNDFLSKEEDGESERYDELTRRLQEAEEDKERLIERGKTAEQIVAEQRQESFRRETATELQKRQELIIKLQERVRGDSAIDSRVVALFVALAGHVDGLLEIPTSVYRGLGKECSKSVVDYIMSIIEGLQGIQEILAGGDV